MPRSSDNWNNDKSTSDSGGFGYSHSSNGGGDAWRDAGERSYGDIPPEYGYQPNANYEQPGSGNSAPKDANYDVTETTEFQPSPPGHPLLSKGNMGRRMGSPRMAPKNMGRVTRRGMALRSRASTSSRINIRRNTGTTSSTGRVNNTASSTTLIAQRMDSPPVPRRLGRPRGHPVFRWRKF